MNEKNKKILVITLAVLAVGAAAASIFMVAGSGEDKMVTDRVIPHEGPSMKELEMRAMKGEPSQPPAGAPDIAGGDPITAPGAGGGGGGGMMGKDRDAAGG